MSDRRKLARALRKLSTDPPASNGLPQHLQSRPDRPWQWPLPTAWLLGTKLLGSLRDIVLSSVVKVDLRTWMTAGEVIDLTGTTTDDGSCTIDVLSDTGDSQRLVYQLARLLKQKELAVKSWRDGQEVTEVLPRGSLLVLGGDTAYPTATHRRLLDRICAPFTWAHDELPASDRDALERRPVALLAVPGNHDYYDGLRGFEALVHSPPVVTSQPADRHGVPPSEQPLRLPGYKLAQHASYFAAALPFGWRLWGLDIEQHEIDDRQLAYFEYAKGWRPGAGPQRAARPLDPPADPPDRLLLVTSRPGFVYQGESDHAEIIKASLRRLGLTPAFDRGGALESQRVRLDLSGDVHLYERYWGTNHRTMPDDMDAVQALASIDDPRLDVSDRRYYEPPDRYPQHASTVCDCGDQASPSDRRRGNDATPLGHAQARPNYASVVSGLGGAFHQPSQVRMGHTPPSASWPSAEHSAREIGVRLVDPYEMFRAGAVGIVGLVVSLACYLLVWSSDRSTNVLDVPFALPALTPALDEALGQLGRVAAMVGIVLAIIALPVCAYYAGRWLGTPIREMRSELWWGARVLRAATHNRFVWPALRFFGANPRSTWLALTASGPWAAAVVGCWWLGGSLGAIGDQVFSERVVIVYAVITILVLGMAALGALRAGQKHPLESWPMNIVRRLFLLGYGALIAVLVIWTPYAWVRLICGNWLAAGPGLVVVLLTMLVRFGRWVFPRGLVARRLATWLGFAALVLGAVLLPWYWSQMRHTHAPPSQLHWLAMLALVAILGGYFACLWVGWYFCIALQWNAHGTEAGGAARITDYGAFLRIKLTADTAEVWAISVEEQIASKPPWHLRLVRRKAALVDPMPTARVIDHFTIGAPNVSAGSAAACNPSETR